MSKTKPKTEDDRLVMTPNGKKRWGFLKRVLDRWEHSIDAFKAIAKKPHAADCASRDDFDEERCDCHVAIAIDWLRDAEELPEPQAIEDVLVEICAHRVNYRYWGIDWRLETEGDFKEGLEAEAEELIKQWIVQGYYSGQLIGRYHDEATGKDHEFPGWWEIDS